MLNEIHQLPFFSFIGMLGMNPSHCQRCSLFVALPPSTPSLPDELLRQWRIQRGFHGFYGTPLLKGCLRKYYAQTYYIHHAHTEATHFSITLEIASCVHVYQKHVAILETISEGSERIKQRFYSCITPSAARDGDIPSVRERLISRTLCGKPATLQPLRPEVESGV